MIRTLSPPRLPVICSAIAWVSSLRPTSPTMPMAPVSQAVPVTASAVRATKATLAPCAASWRTSARPRPDGHLDAVEKVGNAEREPRLAGLQVDADEAEREPERQRGQAAQRRSPKAAETVTKASTISAK